MGDQVVEWVDVSNEQVTEPSVCVFLWRVTFYIDLLNSILKYEVSTMF